MAKSSLPDRPLFIIILSRSRDSNDRSLIGNNDPRDHRSNISPCKCSGGTTKTFLCRPTPDQITEDDIVAQVITQIPPNTII